MVKPTVSISFNIHDLWVGVYWKRFREMNYYITSVYMCLVPLFPIRIDFYQKTGKMKIREHSKWFRDGNSRVKP